MKSDLGFGIMLWNFLKKKVLGMVLGMVELVWVVLGMVLVGQGAVRKP